MTWNAPAIEEIKMDSEIGSYSEDTGDPLVAPIINHTTTRGRETRPSPGPEPETVASPVSLG